MGIKSRITTRPRQSSAESFLNEKLFREERAYRADRLVEKWSRVPEVGKGLTNLETGAARNTAILLENQSKLMSHLSEATLSSQFFGYTPENMLRLIRLSYPNSIRGKLFTEFAMESSHDSIKYILPTYTRSQTGGDMDQRFDNASHDSDVMHESTESRYATEDANVPSSSVTLTDAGSIAVAFTTAANSMLATYSDGASKLYIGDADGVMQPIAIQVEGIGQKTSYAKLSEWYYGNEVLIAKPTTVAGSGKMVKVTGADVSGTTWTFTIQESLGQLQSDGTVTWGSYATPATPLFTSATDENGASTHIAAAAVLAIGRYNSEVDLTGQYLGEVDITIKDYHFNPKAVTLGVTWTQLTDLVLDTSFGISAEEMLLDSAGQEIKKTLDFQAVKYGRAVQLNKAPGNYVVFNAAAGDNTKDSYYHTAQLIGQAITRIGDLQLNAINRGGVSAIVGGPAAVNYLMLNKGWSDKGKMVPIGGHQMGEIDGIPVFKVPSSIIPDDELLTTWKNPQADGDVSIAIGTLMPFYSTGVIQRKNLYKEAAVARFEDTQYLQPLYLGRIKISNIREIAAA